MVATVTGYLLAASEQPDEIYKVGVVSVRLLLAVGDLMIGWRLLEAAHVAHAALEAGAAAEDAAFYEGKIATASFFAATVLPQLSAVRRVVEDIHDTAADLMALPEAAF